MTTQRSDVVVIGGGVIGMTLAYRVRQAGRQVTLLERGRCGSEASWAGAGVLSPPNPHRSDSLYQIHLESLREYPKFCDELKDRTGIDPQFVPCGALDFLTTDQFVRMAASDVRATSDEPAADGQPLLELISPDRAREVEPSVSGDALAFLLRRDTSQVRNPRLLQALRAACESMGVVIVEDCAATGLIRDHSRIHGVRTNTTDFAADRVVLAAGSWSSQLLDEELAALMPVHPVKGQMILLHTDGAPFTRIINKRQTYLVPRLDGMILLGATVEPDAGYDKHNTPSGVGGLMADAMTMVPSLADASVAAMWAGLRPGTPDSRPHLGPVPGCDGLIAATGHFRTGLSLAPITARIVCDLITSGRTSYDISQCAPGRRF